MIGAVKAAYRRIACHHRGCGQMVGLGHVRSKYRYQMYFGCRIS